MKRIVFIALMCIVVLVCLIGYAIAMPPGPPPQGKVWVEVGGKWIPVNAPPGDGPYIWRDSKWIPDPTPPPPGTEWAPGHWGAKRWVPGHWKAVPSPGPDVKWIPGYWQSDKWIPGHWDGKTPSGKNWAPGHRGRGGNWVPGHWR